MIDGEDKPDACVSVKEEGESTRLVVPSFQLVTDLLGLGFKEGFFREVELEESVFAVRYGAMHKRPRGTSWRKPLCLAVVSYGPFGWRTTRTVLEYSPEPEGVKISRADR